MSAPLFQAYEFQLKVFVRIGRNECHSFCFNAVFGGDWEPPIGNRTGSVGHRIGSGGHRTGSGNGNSKVSRLDFFGVFNDDGD